MFRLFKMSAKQTLNHEVAIAVLQNNVQQIIVKLDKMDSDQTAFRAKMEEQQKQYLDEKAFKDKIKPLEQRIKILWGIVWGFCGLILAIVITAIVKGALTQ